MNSHRRGVHPLALKAFALVLGGWVWFDSTVVADDGVVVTDQVLKDQSAKKGHHDDSYTSSGTLGYGAPGIYPGFQGFGLGYHLGYGYGGAALGVGAEGGYPCYGGPGYPHPEPTLRRIGGITPFLHFAGPGYPTPDQPNFFGGVGLLVSEQQVVTIASEGGGSIGSTDYGGFTGGVADPEAQFAPFTTRAAAGAGGGGGGEDARGIVLSHRDPAKPSHYAPDPSSRSPHNLSSRSRTWLLASASGRNSQPVSLELEPVSGDRRGIGRRRQRSPSYQGLQCPQWRGG